MLHNAATYVFAGFSAVAAIGLATWQVSIWSSFSSIFSWKFNIIFACSVTCFWSKPCQACQSELRSVFSMLWRSAGLVDGVRSTQPAVSNAQIVNHLQHYTSPVFQVAPCSMHRATC